MNLKFRINKELILYVFGGFVLGCALMLILWPNRITKLESGEEVVAISKKGYVTAEELFEELKKNDSLDALLNLIDLKLLKDKYPKLEKEANQKAIEQADNLLKMYNETYGMSESDFLSEGRFKNKEAFISVLKDQYYFDKYYEDYLAKKVTDKEIKDFYKNKVFGDRSIVIYSSIDDEKMMKDVKKMLDNKKSQKDIKKKYPKLVVNEIKDFDFSMSSNYSDNFINTIKNLGKGQYSSIIKDDVYGNLIIYVKSAAEKPELENVKEKIVSTISADINASAPNMYYNAFIELRSENELKINDTLLAEDYKNYIKQFK